MSNETWTDDLFVEPSELEKSPYTLAEQEEEVVSLETGLQHLEKIVKTLEQKDLPLEKALNLFKDGVGLVQYCSNVLNLAEKQMEILLEGPDGQLQVKPASFETEG
ncbi:exodeoxyribonuclease VII small subunit [Desulfosporosinus fructosivorans]|uniref:Exodeoxyribonuclease 7 small subunit n=1 Tax=Desulfosporosinus fructosivorans TaxID=2018669 RepID=A0A4Z0R4Q0_9FIRM|nr:exodeoxyribonuclease VII small subunit [Desulfosporosinus fructosivorans]TGE37800.1 exodeoxyribonuclease VII small subunit [Desulfosporosinus fructosivorans]